MFFLKGMTPALGIYILRRGGCESLVREELPSKRKKKDIGKEQIPIIPSLRLYLLNFLFKLFFPYKTRKSRVESKKLICLLMFNF